MKRLLLNNPIQIENKIIKINKSVTIFENEDTAHLLHYINPIRIALTKRKHIFTQSR